MADSSAVTFAAIEQVRDLEALFAARTMSEHERAVFVQAKPALDALQALAEAAERLQGYVLNVPGEVWQDLDAALARVRAGLVAGNEDK